MTVSFQSLPFVLLICCLYLVSPAATEGEQIDRKIPGWEAEQENFFQNR
jgi:hypothetical protein